MTGTLFDDVVAITEEYLGPPAKRFISRQIVYHLHKKPTEIGPGDITKLVEWSRITLALLTEDQNLVDDYAERLTRLAGAEGKTW